MTKGLPPTGLTRRGFVGLTAAAGASALVTACARAAHPGVRQTREPARRTRAAHPHGPRYCVLLLMGGGHDTLYTSDPKLPGAVEPWVGLPADNELVEAASLRLGPGWKALQPLAPRFSILNGVQVGTANHDTGYAQYVRLKTNVSRTMPGILDIIGERRDSQPLGAVYLNTSLSSEHTPGHFGTTEGDAGRSLFDGVASAEPAELGELAAALRRQAQRLERRGSSPAEDVTRQNLKDVSAFLDRVATTPKLVARPTGDDPERSTMAQHFDRALWLIEHDLAACVFIDPAPARWDTHAENHLFQAHYNPMFSSLLAELMSELDRRTNRHGRLAEQTVVVAGSELGRFPRLNGMLGKDHLPQTSFVLSGPGLPGGRAFGHTQRDMQALRVSVKTGEPDRAGRLVHLDDVGTTLLHLFGIDPNHHGYAGRALDFILS